MIKTPYHKLPVLQDIYLEDSFVLGINTDENTALFEMEFVLTEDHDGYRPPRENEQYCYKKGTLRFDKCAKVNWLRVNCHIPGGSMFVF